ncbi:MAG: MFS transporter [Desulfobacteraceae bacterium]|nr:MAG: MFS transporter [Desulfobacteraceae bacterium]
MSDPSKPNIRVLFALTLVHFTGDFYSSFTSPLFPLFVQKIGLTLTEIGIISGVMRLLAFIVQPSVGYLADRYSTRHFILLGVLMPVMFIPLSGIAAGFWSLLILVALGSLGSSMFHPPTTGLIPVYSGNKTGFVMSVFNTAGTLAFGVGPLFITWYATRFGLNAMPFTVAFGLVAAWYLYRVVPVPQSEGLSRMGFWGSLKYSLGDVWKPILCIWIVMVVRAVIGQSFLTFMPVHYVEKGFSVVSAGLMYSLFTVAGTASGLLAGHVSDRIGYRPVFLFTFALMAPALLLFLNLDGHWVYVGSAMAGAMVFATLPLGVAMAQTLAPKSRAMVASLMMGFAFGLGGVVSPLVGRLAELYSMQAVLTGVSFLPLLALPLVFTFPRVR